MDIQDLMGQIPYGRQTVSEEDIQAVCRALREDLLTTGPLVNEFERRLCEITGAGYAVACSSGTAALHIACMAMDVSKGDVGLTSPISFLASANCIEYCGARADFVDIDPDSLCISPGNLEAYCRTHGVPKVVIPVSFAGTAQDLPAIYALGKQYGFRVIEDAAHALGSVYSSDGQTHSCGSCAHSDMAVFSFHPVKTVTSGEGGAVMTNDPVLAAKLRQLRNHGVARGAALDSDPARNAEDDGPWYYEMEELGYNYRITDFQSALGISQLNKLETFREQRRMIAGKYNEAFKGIDALILPPSGLETDACPHLYPIQFSGGPPVRKFVYHHLKEKKIFTQVHYIPIYRQPYYSQKYQYAKGRCPAAETYYSRCLSLPLFPAMSPKEVCRVIDGVLTGI